jgi:hypothetical protein
LNNDRRNRKANETSSMVKSQFWENVAKNKTVYYCKDQQGTLFDETCLIFNINNLNTPFKRYGDWDDGNVIDGAGLTKSYLYGNSRGSAFPGNIIYKTIIHSTYLYRTDK